MASLVVLGAILLFVVVSIANAKARTRNVILRDIQAEIDAEADDT